MVKLNWENSEEDFVYRRSELREFLGEEEDCGSNMITQFYSSMGDKL